uniref:DUF4371 domain-containing protein n=1 Tax=Periophthalmus magnuspinnatus TaxID=409849 RepID=A0A3B4BDN4_9GOBI
MMKKMAKRKKDEEYRTFQQEEWTEEFTFVKRSNIKRHFGTCYATFASKYPARDSKKKACQELLNRVQASQHFVGSLGKVRNRKQFKDGKFLDVANELFDDFTNKHKIIKQIKDLPLSARTDINAATYYSFVLDESTDVSHLSQFSVKKVSTRGEDLFKSFAKEKNLQMDKLILVCTDGVLFLCENENRSILSFYCICTISWIEHLNQLHVKMQGIGNTVLSLQQAVFAFENKLFIVDIGTGRLLHFEKLREFKDTCTASDPSLNARFREFREHAYLEVEVADLEASDMWVNNFKSLNEDFERQQAELPSKNKWAEMKKLQPEDQLIVKTWNELPVTCHTLQRVSNDILTMSFPHIKNIKNNLRSHLTGERLNVCMKLNLTMYQSDKTIDKTTQHQESH